ncbi:response regulator transcription factor [Nocardia cyriacigeorgica]|uniref:response regulator transcription factor n=1 Tax=Nocardia cyriacigeorgica TaxID=135487 RepID=UPI0024586853|nr:response regulator transcription factor [Nocardia cyriacigeorgica]
MVGEHSLTREILRESLEAEDDFTVVADVACDEAVERITALRPDVVLLDIDGMRNSPVELTQLLVGAWPDAALAVLSPIDVGDALHDMLMAGVRCFLHKGVSRSELGSAIRASRTEGTRVTLSVPREFLTNGEPPDSGGGLSDREAQVLELVAQAMTNRQIANVLSITEGTVKRHLRSIFVKLGAVSRIDAVNRYRANSERGGAVG